jgi:hypothetical protein
MKEVLFTISHADFTLSIVGPKPRKSSYALSKIGVTRFDPPNHPYLLNAIDIDNSLSLCKVKVLGGLTDMPLVEYNCQENGEPLPVFFEHIEYNILLTYTTLEKITLSHENDQITNSLSEFRNKIVSGTFNFHNNVGETTFIVKKGKAILLTLNFLVCSTKLSFFTQRKAMVSQIQKVHNSILYELFKPTNEKASSQINKISGLEWLTLFFQYSDEIIKLVRRIENKSHSKLHSRIELKSVNKLRGSDRNFIKQVNKHGLQSVYKYNKVWSDKKVVSNDTSENRYIKFLVFQMLLAGKKWIKYLENTDATDSRYRSILESSYYRRLAGNINEIQKILKNGFWSSIKVENQLLQNRGNFGFHNEFIKTEHYARKLKRGLVYEMLGSEKIYVLSMDKLYELWTYIKIAEIISELITHNSSTIKLKSKTTEFSTSILTGAHSKIDIGEHLTIQTNKLFTKRTVPYRVPLVNQKPDIVFEIMNKNALILFDAKYKINIWRKNNTGDFELLSYRDLITKSLKGDELIFLPNDEDINVIHRYKDAIYLENSGTFSHAVWKGFILFPGSIDSDSLLESKFSTGNFNIGYLPFTPGEKDEDWNSKTGLNLDRSSISSATEDIRAVIEALLDLLSKA